MVATCTITSIAYRQIKPAMVLPENRADAEPTMLYISRAMAPEGACAPVPGIR